MADEAIKRRKTKGTNQLSEDAEPQGDWFTQRRLSDDVTLKFVDGKELFASRGLLICASPYFERMFEHDMKEKETNSVDLSVKNYDHFLELLKCLHPRIAKPVTHENVFYLADLAHEYDMKGLFKRCRDAFTMVIRQKGLLCKEGIQLSTSNTQEWLEDNHINLNNRGSRNNINPANNILRVLSSVAKFQDELLNTDAINHLSRIAAVDYVHITSVFDRLSKTDQTIIKQNKEMFDQLDADLRAKISSARLKKIDSYE